MVLAIIFFSIIFGILGIVCGCLFSFYANAIILVCIFSLWLILWPYWNRVMIVYNGLFFIIVWTILMLIAWAWRTGYAFAS
jgi:hypothetical protein